MAQGRTHSILGQVQSTLQKTGFFYIGFGRHVEMISVVELHIIEGWVIGLGGGLLHLNAFLVTLKMCRCTMHSSAANENISITLI